MKTARLPVLILLMVSVGVAKTFGMALHQKDPVGDLKSWVGKPSPPSKWKGFHQLS